MILSTADTPAGAIEGIGQALPTGNIFAGTAQMTSLSSAEKEKAPQKKFLQRCTVYMKTILDEAGYLKG